MTVRASPLAPGDWADLKRMLAAEQLPTGDLEDEHRWFWRLEDDDGHVGYGGLEGDGADRLLRSLVICPSRRGQGLGGHALHRIEEAAWRAGATRLHLLTRHAASFFRAHGYRDASRAAAPAVIAGSRQFAGLCPASADYLVKDGGTS